ncbi:MAG TPA: T9SS type A sorting domain-containing protein, partial [Saprospiraceae bacterium]|nr:T9SS type A sorting domain-containing protein [Saprospiraceae bacterium]
NEAPTALCKNITVELGQNGTVTIQPSQLNGGSTDNCTTALNFAASQTVFTTANIGTTLVTLTVTDAGGNSSTCTAIVTIPTYCVESGNDLQLWNQPEFFDALHETQNLSESKPDLSWQLPYYCPQGTQYVRYRLFLDLDSDGVTETVVSNLLPIESGMVRFGNENTPNFAGGNLVAFDSRDLGIAQKYRFDLELEDTGTKYIAKVRWTTADAPGQYLLPQLPLGKHRIQWNMLDVCEDKYEQIKSVELVDCTKPKVACAGKMSVNIGRGGKAYVDAAKALRSATDNCTPYEQLAISLRKGNAGTTMPLGPTGDPVKKVAFGCNELGNQTVQVWVGDRSGNLEMCTVNVTVKDPSNLCLPEYTGETEDRESVLGEEGDAFRLMQNQPNPFAEETVIGFYLPAATTATLTVYEESGRMIYTAQGDYAKGLNSVKVDKAMLGNASGVLYYRITTDTDSATRKMILTNR